MDKLLIVNLSHKSFREEMIPESVVPMDNLLDEGYQALGWDKATGIPLKETLQELEISELIE